MLKRCWALYKRGRENRKSSGTEQVCNIRPGQYSSEAISLLTYVSEGGSGIAQGVGNTSSDGPGVRRYQEILSGVPQAKTRARKHKKKLFLGIQVKKNLGSLGCC
jgi:hypothetical protein